MIENIKIWIGNPWFWIYILVPFLFLFLLPSIRKLYPKKMQEKIIECDIQQKNPNKATVIINKKIHKVGFLIVSILLILFLTILLMFDEASSSFTIRDWFLQLLGSTLFTSLGIYSLFKEYILKKILTTDEYKNYNKKIAQQLCLESEFDISKKFILLINKYEKSIGIVLIIIGFFYLNITL